MKSFNFALVSFLALCLSTMSIQAQTGPSSSACQKICSKVCSKSSAATAVVNPNANVVEKASTNQQESGQAVNVSLVETKTAVGSDVANQVIAKKKVNCDPANCDPANCNPANCPPANCDPSKCVKKAKSDKAL